MKALRVGVDFYLNADEIQIIQPYPGRGAAREKGKATDEGRYYDATRGRRLLSIITLRNGWVVGSLLTATRLIQRPLVVAPQVASFSRDEPRLPAERQAIEVTELAPAANGHNGNGRVVTVEPEDEGDEDEPDDAPRGRLGWPFRRRG